MRYVLLLVLLTLALVGCVATPTPEPTLEPTAIPTEIPPPTEPPTNTPLPPTPTLEPTVTPLPPTATPILPTNTPLPTPTHTRRPLTPRPAATATPSPVVFLYNAPELVEPTAGDTRLVGRDDLVFRWNPVGDLGANECYQLTLQVVNLADPNQNYGEGVYLVSESCNSRAEGKPLQFVVRRRAPAPDYAGLIATADALAGVPSQEYLGRWRVQVVLQQDGQTIPLSPPSAWAEFKMRVP